MSKNNFQNVLFSLGLVFFIIAFYYTVVLFSHFELENLIDKLSTKDPNEIGDTVGGILNPLFAISICIFTGLAFYVQYEANQQIQKQFKIQALEKEVDLISNQIIDFRYQEIKKESSDNSFDKQNEYYGIIAISKILIMLMEENNINENFIIQNSFEYNKLFCTLDYFELILDKTIKLRAEDDSIAFPKLNYIFNSHLYIVLKTIYEKYKKEECLIGLQDNKITEETYGQFTELINKYHSIQTKLNIK